MFPKKIRYLLKYYDVFGFCTETNSDRKATLKTFIVHILIGSFVIVSFLFFAWNSIEILDNTLLVVNRSLQMFSEASLYWVTIFESLLKRNHQRKLWNTYRQIQNFAGRHQNPPKFYSYFFIFCEYLFVFSTIQLISMYYYLYFVGLFFYFNISYIIVVKMYHNRVFYYLFHLELIKHEFLSIRNEVKRIAGADISKFDFSFNIQSFRRIRERYKLLQDMVNHLNEVFGWSQLASILCALHLLLTELNWAFSSISVRTTGYKICMHPFNFPFGFLIYIFHFSLDYCFWITHHIFIISYMFVVATQCRVHVSIELQSDVFSGNCFDDIFYIFQLREIAFHLTEIDSDDLRIMTQVASFQSSTHDAF